MLWADGHLFDGLALPTLIAGPRAGLAIWEIRDAWAELVLLQALEPRHGIGTALLDALVAQLVPKGVRELRLSTTNDNLDALRFYQRRGFRLIELRAGAMTEARRIKPTIPEMGEHGIPMRDELRLVRDIAPG
jgi:GNAT superfamily N-acetyltransferase